MKKYLGTAANIAIYFIIFYFSMYVFELMMKVKLYSTIIVANPSINLISIFCLSMLLYWLVHKWNLIFLNTERKTLAKVLKLVKVTPKTAGFSFLIGLAGALASIGLLQIASLNKMFPDLEENVHMMMNSGNFVLIIVALGILFPALEEVIFRGLMFNTLKKVMPISVAVIIQMVAYCLVQPSVAFMLISVVTGTVYCLIYIIVRSLWAPIIVQTTAMSLFFIGYKLEIGSGISNDPLAFTVTIAGLVIMIGLTILLMRKKRRSQLTTTY
ncbi:MAG: CPBP family intramembrane metalloprotease [Candidatus Pristimantibacillus lignocellulolyticus]|uniref:CPBP family intramembrane metalloprotease n=1 Tax=Candidatus Pristimantibacillus lignocellulolyticus TaxID=2994561 RepID=A0A9J6ZCP1_9BACL|nr:MAG: CPBP family intramembrane metalloprotease [Candidatus Pristimantibacillus lignocellulolyticus]